MRKNTQGNKAKMAHLSLSVPPPAAALAGDETGESALLEAYLRKNHSPRSSRIELQEPLEDEFDILEEELLRIEREDYDEFERTIGGPHTAGSTSSTRTIYTSKKDSTRPIPATKVAQDTNTHPPALNNNADQFHHGQNSRVVEAV